LVDGRLSACASVNKPQCVGPRFNGVSPVDRTAERMFINDTTSIQSQDIKMGFLQKHGVLIASVVLALIVAGAGVAKLMGVPMVHQSFAILGLPTWFGYFIGAAEVAGAIGLFIRPLSALAALGLAIIGAGAVYFHVTNPPISAGVPAILVLLLAVFIAIKRRGAGQIA
jgi:putative oxidoreductase